MAEEKKRNTNLTLLEKIDIIKNAYRLNSARYKM